MFQFFINFKTYSQATGQLAIKLAKICADIGRQKKTVITPIVQVADIYPVSQMTASPCWVQHLDWQKPGQATGWISLKSVIAAGASGTLLSHSEHSLPPGTIKQTLKRVREENGDFRVMVCAGTLGQIKKLVFTKPDYLAYEVKELIAGSVSISRERPAAIKKAVALAKAKDVPLVIGAGISSREDVLLAKKMGAAGVLVSSAVVLAKNPKEKLAELAG